MLLNELQNGITFSSSDARLPMELLSPATGRQLLLGYKFYSKDAYDERIVRGLFSSQKELEKMILQFAEENLKKAVKRDCVKNMKLAAHKPLNKAIEHEI